MYSKLFTEDFLRYHHHMLNKSVLAISREFGCANHTVSYYLRKFGLKQNLPRYDNRQMEKGSRWKGIGKVPKSYWTNMLRGAATRNHQVEIDHEYIAILFEKQEGKCALTGQSISFSATNNKTASLDRIDSNLGYVKGNVWWLHKDVNLAKRSLSVDAFISLCEMVVKHKCEIPSK